ncbi:MAG TPA: T9SS type A sorting domain-containing protein, partial [Flavobacteriales bacterium]|nr:T9SS type A sorting domain-containing protein [Flavobacteriales bacterium]
DLIIANSSTSTDAQNACDSYTWIDSITYTVNNNSATHTLANAAGCDSVVTLDLIIASSSTSTDAQNACDSYTWIDSITYTANNNSATHTLANAAGCDSVVTLDLSVDNLTPSITLNGNNLTMQPAGGTYQWLDCDNSYAPIAGETNQYFTPTASGNYAGAITLGACIDTTDCESVTIAGLQESKKSELHLYPNPTTGILTIEGVQGTVSIYDIYGRLVLSAKANTVDISNADMGIYFIRVLDEQGNVYVGKVLKE